MKEHQLQKKIDADLGEAKKLFNGDYTILVKTAVKHGYGAILGEHLKKAYLNEKGIKDGRIIEGILTSAMYHCENNYCCVIHSAWLLNMDIKFKHVTTMLESLDFPEHIEDHNRWSRVLKLVYFSFKDKNTSVKNLEIVRSMLSDEEYEHFTSIISLATFLEFLLTSFQSEIQVNKEFLFIDKDNGKLNPDISLFIKFYYDKKMEDAKSQVPVFVMCIYCKDIKDNEGHWHKIEGMITSLPTDASFSHSICDSCFGKMADGLSPTELSA